MTFVPGTLETYRGCDRGGLPPGPAAARVWKDLEIQPMVSVLVTDVTDDVRAALAGAQADASRSTSAAWGTATRTSTTT